MPFRLKGCRDADRLDADRLDADKLDADKLDADRLDAALRACRYARGPVESLTPDP
jgi:hypothetical protein